MECPWEVNQLLFKDDITHWRLNTFLFEFDLRRRIKLKVNGGKSNSMKCSTSEKQAPLRVSLNGERCYGSETVHPPRISCLSEWRNGSGGEPQVM